MSRAESKARTREQLLDSAESVFARRGYTAATIEEISEGAGFSRGAFYANFADKSEVFLAIAEAGQQQAFAEIAARIDATEAEGILDMMYEWFTRVLVHGRLRRALDEFRLVAIDDPSLRKRLASFERAATLYAQALLYALATRWNAAIGMGTSALEYHAEPASLAIGYFSGVAVAAVTIYFAVRRQSARTARDLSRSVAMRAPSAIAPSLVQVMAGSTVSMDANVAKPQSVPAINRSWPIRRA